MPNTNTTRKRSRTEKPNTIIGSKYNTDKRALRIEKNEMKPRNRPLRTSLPDEKFADFHYGNTRYLFCAFNSTEKEDFLNGDRNTIVLHLQMPGTIIQKDTIIFFVDIDKKEIFAIAKTNDDRESSFWHLYPIFLSNFRLLSIPQSIKNVFFMLGKNYALQNVLINGVDNTNSSMDCGTGVENYYRYYLWGESLLA